MTHDPGTRAQATLAQLKIMRPKPHEVTQDQVLRLTIFGSLERWRRICGSGDKATFEMEGC